MVVAAKISSKRQVTIPLQVMLRLKLHPGDKLVFEEKNGHMEVKSKAEKFTIRDFVNAQKGMTTKKLTDAQIRRARQDAWLERAQEI